MPVKSELQNNKNHNITSNADQSLGVFPPPDLGLDWCQYGRKGYLQLNRSWIVRFVITDQVLFSLPRPTFEVLVQSSLFPAKTRASCFGTREDQRRMGTISHEVIKEHYTSF